jgi:branched-subunit amino acid transport protein AzlD
MDCSEAVTEQVLRIQAFYILHFFREMTFWGVVAKYVPYNVPGVLTASDYPALKLLERLGICIILDVGIC